MSEITNHWSLVLAAGSGTRLRSLTTNRHGAAVPKQFCSLNGGPSLLEETCARARAFSHERRTLVVVASEHRVFWEQVLAGVPSENVIEQPANRGTANGILLGVTAILERDAAALVTILPSDHYVGDEDVLRRSISQAIALAKAPMGAPVVHFLGIKPETADPELGYIVCGEPSTEGSFEIARFVEKPSRKVASSLLRRRALWNSFILVARAAALVGIVERHFPTEVAAFKGSWQVPSTSKQRDLERLYSQLREIDFSRDVVERTRAAMRVVPVPSCGWSDLGTPNRVAACLERLGARSGSAPSRHPSLAESYARLMGAMTVAAQST